MSEKQRGVAESLNAAMQSIPELVKNYTAARQRTIRECDHFYSVPDKKGVVECLCCAHEKQAADLEE